MDGQSLLGRVALVTGVSRRKGIGFAIASRLAALGADLYLQAFSDFDAQQPWGADPGGSTAICDQLRQHGHRVAYTEANFLEPSQAGSVVASAVQAFGYVDILVVNHAYSCLGSLESLTAQDIDMHLLINVRASLLLIQAFVAQHKGRAHGRVILLTSGQHLAPMPDELAYVASKGALHQLTLSLAAALVSKGITVNTVNPGATNTGYASSALYDAVLAQEPQGRWGQPDDAARLIAWLASCDASWITGQVINSTGGGP